MVSEKKEASKIRSLGILTGGGDCPGLNAVIRAVVLTAERAGVRIQGIRNAYSGLVHNQFIDLDSSKVDHLLQYGGTILGSSNRDNPFEFMMTIDGERRPVDVSDTVISNFHNAGLDGLIAIGGDGTLQITHRLTQKGLPAICVPKTIDNDLLATDVTFGFDTAVGTATEAIDRLRTTAESHGRLMVVEVMGRNAGWIALFSGLAGGADVILLPEIPFTIEAIANDIRIDRSSGKNFSIIVVAEGAHLKDGEVVIQRMADDPTHPQRLGGIGNIVGHLLEEKTGYETRVTVLGHIQRGGTPSTYDRNLSTRFGVHAALTAIEGRFGHLVALQNGSITLVPMADAAQGQRLVSLDSDFIGVARSVGISFGDEN
ncbi:MAG: ATP-dependent 6-phosphofructokinase [Nitrospinaceae bacterium]|jgi:ATP-dependent phosphofructokinase / diphosphate-dependent phosphofructokinase|nr:ATP-dependent 6-phosphofructokinase [Nitrospinaceae bacterium]MBT3433927.1 ATP-dependent 6-phosphofructokinase [Nitrospinaceae bacterium]MBT3821616.1 ATP-dependent 6-phosphofructokinase [Nitrospinaceae bacterium]MBT4093990.1 ATP-dependent 6-phosphofructokinase [Nitrospinaceae bacterium]MBT4430286.1 ATP-dependent 6-phosphofructokinase [Nitrospinaceae bacterium]